MHGLDIENNILPRILTCQSENERSVFPKTVLELTGSSINVYNYGIHDFKYKNATRDRPYFKRFDKK